MTRLLLVALLLVCPSWACGDEVFEPPFRVEADGAVIDTGKAWGHCGPCLEDLDDDGLPDLIVGDFGGKFAVYLNVGEPGAPRFQASGNVLAGTKEAEVRIYCCVGSQPRFVDLNGDGVRDFVSNSYDPGHCYFFPALAPGAFGEREELKDAAGVPIRSSPVQQQDYQSFGSFFTPVDWDADGDFDLLVGCFDGHLKLRLNEGTATEPEFATENTAIAAAGEPLKVEAHNCPAVADWDGDGLWDLICGSDDGSVTWFRNTGTKTEPQFAAGETLVAAYEGDDKGYNISYLDDAEIVPGIRSQPEVADWNGDGKLDLIVGDFCTAYDFRADLTDEEKQQVRDLMASTSEASKAFADKMQALRDSFAEKYPGDAVFSDEADKEWAEAYQKLQESPEAKAREAAADDFAEKMRPYLASTRGDQNYNLAKSHGYVWVFLRK
ncbi:MAG: FG-GAP-like repeat-containing protein [Planctomycetota bacterium]